MRFLPLERVHSTSIQNVNIQPVAAIVVAAGSGVRFGSAIPKALVKLAGVPLVRHAADALVAGGVTRLEVVCPADAIDQIRAALAGCPVPVGLGPGGISRQESVALGLSRLGADADAARLVLVHDAARPLVPPAVVQRVIAALQAGADAVVPVVPVTDTIRQLDAGVVDRARLRAVQTPQGFRREVLEAAHAAALPGIENTDDAVMCEAVGTRVSLVEGSRDSLKITEPLDLLVAEAVLASRATDPKGS